MRQLGRSFAILCLAVILGMPSYGMAAGARQNKMKTCNAEADDKGLSGEGKGPERQAFMKDCLSAKSQKAATGATSQQSKMKSCNKDASSQKLKGDERKKFMSACLSNE